jgi:dipeptidase
MGCDTIVALAPATAAGRTLFGKNSDRPPRECQRIVQHARTRHAPGSRVRCQYLEVPQVGETAAVVGSQPHWLWGFEHGVNEHRVAIGNELVFTKEVLGPRGLLGMDLVRLGLERGRTADEALNVMTALLEEHGQGGSGQPHVDWPYSNGFIVADPREAWILETSGRHWVARRVRDLGNVSNALGVGADWQCGAADVTRFAAAQGWWSEADGPVDFAAAYADPNVPEMVAYPRRTRAAALLAEGRGSLAPHAFRAILRDHYEHGAVYRPRAADDPHFFSLCMHADPLDNTTASMVTSLDTDPSAVHAIWVCLGSPCTGAYLPLFLEGTVPASLGLGGPEPDDTPWWRMRALLSLVEEDFATRGPLVRARWDRFEADLVRSTTAVETEATALGRAGRPDEARRLLTDFMVRSVDAWLAHAGVLAEELRATRSGA